jgi:hypothetical protein
MATLRVPAFDAADEKVPRGKELLGYEESLISLTDDEVLKATIYAMNTLLIQKGIYTAEEFRFQFRQSAQKQLRKRGSVRT